MAEKEDNSLPVIIVDTWPDEALLQAKEQHTKKVVQYKPHRLAYIMNGLALTAGTGLTAIFNTHVPGFLLFFSVGMGAAGFVGMERCIAHSRTAKDSEQLLIAIEEEIAGRVEGTRKQKVVWPPAPTSAEDAQVSIREVTPSPVAADITQYSVRITEQTDSRKRER